ncbi:MAG: beta-aspartyl-peptidase [Clostridiales bacterium 43-6]|nr:MAG: beta-aspartyl-peptidase [Clostridiales bacterium 43-6]
MITLLKNITCYCPRSIGKKDILLSGETFETIADCGVIAADCAILRVINCEGLYAFPGLIDQHVHLIGGGGEEGYASRIDEISFEEIILAGVTTVVGLLGADSYTKNMNSLLAKVRALEIRGLTAFLYSGSYALPVTTLTGDIVRDLVLIDKVIGTGEIAIADHRSSNPNAEMLLETATKTHLGGLLSGKAGVMHIHLGDGKRGIQPIVDLLRASDLPVAMFIPTHANRNPRLFESALDYLKNGGHIDLTAGETAGLTVPDAVEKIIQSGADISRVTISSDANGSSPTGAAGTIDCLYADTVAMIKNKNISPETAFCFVTENVANTLNLSPRKGVLQEGSDGDILITDKDLTIKKVFSKGVLCVDNQRIIKNN